MPNLFKTICDYLDTELTQKTQQTRQQINQYNIQMMNQQIASQQIQVQSMLFQVLSGVTISPQLCSLNVPLDLMPCGTRFINGNIVYYFAWTKKDYSSKIAISMLRIYVQKMNTAIQAQRTIQLNYYMTPMFSLLNNGLYVQACKDVGNSILLAVTC